ncbi:hypothetical protein COU80_04840 [Candidatus Peregrinibacteria bacterium CG10_big_fil_rev_8_21_14_0_10_55_24]|nr:MAG: hypothetical protein COU80_04840 [Candidatus Peregrinibacteria bacterium CG10_big_fil_rev_8_21_14_0_10_55_24]
MNERRLPTNGPEALDAAETYVTKIGGDNAGKLAFNADNIAARSRQGKEQILAVSALRSSDGCYTELADAAVADFTPDGRRKPGFNTTSHLIAIAQRLREGDPDALAHAERMVGTIASFTRELVHSEVARDANIPDKDEAFRQLDGMILEHIDDAQDPRSLISRIRRWKDPLAAFKFGVDWVIHSDDEYLSVTGIGERLAQYLYLTYLRIRGVVSLPMSIEPAYQSIFRNIDRDADSSATIEYMRDLISRQIAAHLETGGVVVAGGYLPLLGSQRGYSDKTGALLASATQRTGRDVVYLVEKEFPLMSADPKRVPGAQTVRRMTHFLARELFGDNRGAKSGALHPEALDMLAQQKIPVVVMNPEQPVLENNTTLIQDFDAQPDGVEIVTSKDVPFALQIADSALVGNPVFDADMMHFFSRHGAAIQHIATSEGTVSFTFHEGEFGEPLRKALDEHLAVHYGISDPHVIQSRKDLALIYCLGNNMQRPGQAAKATTAFELAGIDIQFITQGLNEAVMTFLVRKEDADAAVQMLHSVFISVDDAEYDQAKARFYRAITALIARRKHDPRQLPHE